MAQETRMKLTMVLGSGTAGENVEIRGRSANGDVVVELPGSTIAMLAAMFTHHAAELKSGSTRLTLHPTFQVTGYELLEPKPEGMGLKLTCLPELNLWFSLPTAALDDLATAFQKAADVAAKTRSLQGRPS